MVTLDCRRIELKKRYPLTISRGTSAGSENLYVTLSDGVHQGLGELAPASGAGWTAERGEAQLRAFWRPDFPISPHRIWQEMKAAEIDPPAIAALDTALWDLLAKRTGLPLFQLLGLPREQVPTSVTAGLEAPEVTRERVPEILARTGAKNLKIKLGSPDGADHDRDHFQAAAEAARPLGVALRVDANGGWDPPTARAMIRWLAERGVAYVEQPLPEGSEADLPADRALPIFLDESIRFSTDVPRWADRIDGINLKLMKCGGVTEALRIVATARAHGLKTMIGCMSESSVAIAAGAALGALFDHIDLDSHLNLVGEPATGLPLVDGRLVPPLIPGHGARLIDDA